MAFINVHLSVLTVLTPFIIFVTSAIALSLVSMTTPRYVKLSINSISSLSNTVASIYFYTHDTSLLLVYCLSFVQHLFWLATCCLQEIKSAKSKSSNTPGLSPMIPRFFYVVCFIVQSITRGKRSPHIIHLCLTPDLS